MRYLQTKEGQNNAKKYLQSDKLQFVLKVLEKYKTDSNLEETQETEAYVDHQLIGSSLMEENTSPKRLASRKRKNNNCDEVYAALLAAFVKILKACKLDEDDAFFASVKSSVSSFTEDEKLNFRMELMSLIKNIKYKRRLGNTVFPSGALSSTPNNEENYTNDCNNLSLTSLV